jgi:hypothetical protein
VRRRSPPARTNSLAERFSSRPPTFCHVSRTKSLLFLQVGSNSVQARKRVGSVARWDGPSGSLAAKRSTPRRPGRTDPTSFDQANRAPSRCEPRSRATPAARSCMLVRSLPVGTNNFICSYFSAAQSPRPGSSRVLFPAKGNWGRRAGGAERTRLVEAAPCRLTTPASPAPWRPASGATGRRSASARRAASAPRPLAAH